MHNGNEDPLQHGNPKAVVLNTVGRTRAGRTDNVREKIHGSKNTDWSHTGGKHINNTRDLVHKGKKDKDREQELGLHTQVN